MGEPLRPIYDLDRAAFPPAINPNLVVDGRDTLRPHTPEDYVQYGCNSFVEIANVMQSELSRRDEMAGETGLTEEHSYFMRRNPAAAGVVEDESPDPEAGPVLRESEQYRTIPLPPGVGVIGEFSVAWDKYEQRGGAIVKIRPEVPLPGSFVIEGDQENLSVEDLMRQHGAYQAKVEEARTAQNNAPEYTWESEHPGRIIVTTHEGAPVQDLKDMDVGLIVDIARFTRTAARLIALHYEDAEALANLMPSEHNPADFRGEVGQQEADEQT